MQTDQAGAYVFIVGKTGNAKVLDLLDCEISLMISEIVKNPDGFVAFETLTPAHKLWVRCSDIVVLQRVTAESRRVNNEFDQLLDAENEAEEKPDWLP